MYAVKPEGSPFNSPTTERQLQTPSEMDTKTWLTLVNYHAENGASEDMSSLKQLAKAIPEFDAETTPEMQEVVDQIKGIAESKRWSPDLSPTSSKALMKIVGKITPSGQDQQSQAHPKCRKQLFFDDKGI